MAQSWLDKAVGELHWLTVVLHGDMSNTEKGEKEHENSMWIKKIYKLLAFIVNFFLNRRYCFITKIHSQNIS